MGFKRCLVGLQKGVSKTSKGHLLQAKRALIESQLTPFYFSFFELSLQYRLTVEDRMTKRQRGLKTQKGRKEEHIKDKRKREDVK